jgi:hypothetical protein
MFPAHEHETDTLFRLLTEPVPVLTEPDAYEQAYRRLVEMIGMARQTNVAPMTVFAAMAAPRPSAADGPPSPPRHPGHTGAVCRVPGRGPRGRYS